ncbi:uncharacterized protein [Erythrolamprus reginae]|uniref:uncharacterized protein n=1 Tax=Erythrolamprus reginae TaxID=121349 RepID=UPI00396C853E
MSVNNLEEEGPEAPHLTPQEWLKESIKSIQDLQKSMISVQNSLRDRWIEKSIQDLKKQYSEEPMENILQWLQTSLENLSVSEEHTEDLQNQYSEGPLENILQRLQSSVESQSFYKEPDPVLENLEQESPDKSKYIKKWLEMSINNLEPEGPEVPHLDSQEWLKTSIKGIQDFKKQSSKTPKLSLGYSKESVVQVAESGFSKRGLRNGWLQETLASSREHGSIASRTSVQAWLQTSLERLKQDSSEGAKNNLKEWLQDSIENIQMECPKESIPYAKEWLDTVINQFQEGGSETSYLSVEEWLKTSIQGLKEEILEEMTGGKDPKIWTTKVSKRIPSQEKTLRNELNKLWMCSRKKTGTHIEDLRIHPPGNVLYFFHLCTC